MGAQTLAHVQGHMVAIEAPQEDRASGGPQRHRTLPHHVNAVHVPEASTHTRPGPGLRGAGCHSSVNQTVPGRTCLGTSRRHEKSRGGTDHGTEAGRGLETNASPIRKTCKHHGRRHVKEEAASTWSSHT